MRIKKAFTLAEIMIVLTVIGILTAILMPIAMQSAPDENVMKFKKANATFGTVIRELVNSDKYYCNGDLGIMHDCSTLVFDHTYVATGLNTSIYLCRSMADILTTKEVTCKDVKKADYAVVLASNDRFWDKITGNQVTLTVTDEKLSAAKNTLDEYCKAAAIQIGKEIVTSDDVVWYQGGTSQHGSRQTTAANGTTINLRYFSPPGQHPANYSDQNGFDIAYKVYCIDVDGIPSNATSTDCVNECPFGYGIRADGKILTGKRADEWIEKSVQRGED